MNTKHVLLSIIIAQCVLTFCVFIYKMHEKHKKEEVVDTIQNVIQNIGQRRPLIHKLLQPPPQVEEKPVEQLPEAEPVETIQPTFTNYPSRRHGSGEGVVLPDIDGHLVNNVYREPDRITWGHEDTHGINSDLRQKYQGGRPSGWDGKKWMTVDYATRINGFYCLENRACIIEEPMVRISRVASSIPPSLRGGVYELYLIKQAASWGDTPLYIFDEWDAYTNGSAVRKDLHIASRAETVDYMVEFDVYAMTLAMVVKQYDPAYDDKQFKAFIMWNIDRSMKIYNNEPKTTAYLQRLRTSQDADNLRKFARGYFGADWCKRTLGF